MKCDIRWSIYCMISLYLVVVHYWALDKCLLFVPCRDDYDKEVKQAKELQRRRHTTTPRRPRRPDIQVYHPRSRRELHKLRFLHIIKLLNVDLLVNFQMNLSPEAQLRLKSGMRVGLVPRLRSRELNYSGLTIKQILETLLLSLCTRLNAHSYQWFFFAFDFFPLTSILISSCHCLAVSAGR